MQILITKGKDAILLCNGYAEKIIKKKMRNDL